MELEQRAHDQREAERVEALRIHAQNAHHLVDAGCAATVESLRRLNVVEEDAERLVVDLEFIEEMITRCNLQWIEQESDAEELVDGVDDGDDDEAVTDDDG